jgi:branched-chain amino acid transport system permease protein
LPVSSPTIFGFSIGTNSPVRGLDGALPSPIFGVGVIILLVLIAFVVGNIRRTSLGKKMLAIRSNERAAASGGISATRVKLAAFAISAAIMAIAGVLYGYNFSELDSTRFTVFNTLGLVGFAYLGGITTIRGAIIGGLIITQGLFSYILDHFLGISVEVQLVLAGVLLIVTVIMNPDGIALTAHPRWPGRLRRRLRMLFTPTKVDEARSVELESVSESR